MCYTYTCYTGAWTALTKIPLFVRLKGLSLTEIPEAAGLFSTQLQMDASISATRHEITKTDK